MSERVKWIEHKGLKILLDDYNDLPEAEFIAEIKETCKLIIESEDKVVFSLANMTGVRITDVTRQAGQEIVDSAEAKGITIYITMVGLSKIQRIIANAVVKDVYFAKDEEDAKEWLLRKAEKVKQPVS